MKDSPTANQQPMPGDALKAMMRQRDDAFNKLEAVKELAEQLQHSRLEWGLACEHHCGWCAAVDAAITRLLKAVLDE